MVDDIIAPFDAFELLLCARYRRSRLRFVKKIRSYDWFRWKSPWRARDSVRMTAVEVSRKFTEHVARGHIRLRGILSPQNPPLEIDPADCRDGDLDIFDRTLKIYASPQTFRTARIYSRVYCVKADVLKLVDTADLGTTSEKAVEPRLKKPAGASRHQIKAIVTDYRKGLKDKAAPSISSLEQFASNNGLSGHRSELRAEYRNQFPGRRVGRPAK
jgi:hypothetical protein